MLPLEGKVAIAADRFGPLDCLMNNAGRGSQFAAIADVDREQFDAVIAAHLRAVLAGMKYASPVMAAQGTGSIINVASVNGIRAGPGGHYPSRVVGSSGRITRQWPGRRLGKSDRRIPDDGSVFQIKLTAATKV